MAVVVLEVCKLLDLHVHLRLMTIAVGPLLTPAFVPLAEQFGVPLQRFTLG